MERAEALNYQLLDLRDDGEGLRQMPLLINSQRGFGAVHLIWKFMFFMSSLILKFWEIT